MKKETTHTEASEGAISTPAQHTPGPWQVEPGHMQTATLQYWQVTDGQDAICCNQFCYAGGSEANARLIAAAPTMLALLQELIDIEGPQPGTAEWARKVRAVIAKATRP